MDSLRGLRLRHRGGKDTRMDTLAINHTLMGDTYARNIFGGTWALDEIEKKWKRCQQVPVCFVVNSAPSWHPGTHWTAVYLDNGSMEHFCSFGIDAPEKLADLMGCHYQRNTRRLQTTTSDLCGEYCILYLLCRCRGYSLQDFVKCFSRDTSVNDKIVNISMSRRP